MDINQFDYKLPLSLIAQYPATHRSSSRLLVVPRENGQIQHLHFTDLLGLVNRDDLLVVNDTRVIPARLFARKPTGGRVEILLERIEHDNCALVMLKASKSLRDGQELLVGNHIITVRGRQGAFFRCQFPPGSDVQEIFEQMGSVPLPPYISREPIPEDVERYQTVYSRIRGAVAAPTAGLHFEQSLIDSITAKGVGWSSVTLHVGAGTFQPVRNEDIAAHRMHAERFTVTKETCNMIEQARSRGGRVIAVGTTVVRALESAAQAGKLVPTESDTELFVYPGYQFNVVDALVTNFHLPRSTLLMMVCAFAGYEKIMRSYRCAIESKYRFYSYGDAMFVERG
jgi:S-adenosylmethionine:tRNA ribosyltransferase-isomerase